MCLYSSVFFFRGAFLRAGAFFAAAAGFFAVLVLRAAVAFFSAVALSFFVVERAERVAPIAWISMRVRWARKPRRRL